MDITVKESVVEAILLNIFLSYHFVALNEIEFASSADRNTLYKAGDNIDVVMKTLKISVEQIKQYRQVTFYIKHRRFKSNLK